jgi:hypothetical protein
MSAKFSNERDAISTVSPLQYAHLGAEGKLFGTHATPTQAKPSQPTQNASSFDKSAFSYDLKTTDV